ncbi:MAG: EamA family transporter, partial [Pseudomonadota bacterium]|nr:EamA family transporter [Pseudomonadota bacterium]
MNVHPIPTSHTPLIGLLLVLTAAFAFSTKAIIIKLAYAYGGQVSPIILLTLRMVMSLPFFLIALVILNHNSVHTPITKGDYLHIMMLGVIGFYLAAYLDFVGLSYISASL